MQTGQLLCKTVCSTLIISRNGKVIWASSKSQILPKIHGSTNLKGDSLKGYSQPNCGSNLNAQPLLAGWWNCMWHLCSLEHCSAINKNSIVSFEENVLNRRWWCSVKGDVEFNDCMCLSWRWCITFPFVHVKEFAVTNWLARILLIKF